MWRKVNVIHSYTPMHICVCVSLYTYMYACKSNLIDTMIMQNLRKNVKILVNDKNSLFFIAQRSSEFNDRYKTSVLRAKVNFCDPFQLSMSNERDKLPLVIFLAKRDNE